MSFMLPQYFVRGVVMAPTFDCSKPNLYYLMDAIDSDHFLRLGN